MNCLGCYKPLEGNPKGGYHARCSKRLFGSETPPIVDFGADKLAEMAMESLNQHLGVTGVQPKISVDLTKKKDDPTHRLMIVGLWGNFILKPSTERFPHMAVVEDATMHMAEAAGINTARHGLLRLKSGQFAYITRRFDRGPKKKKIHLEDFCQLSGQLTESKYNSSTEKAGKIILKYSSNPGLDVQTFFDLTLLCYLTGNADMHLKNFSLIEKDNGDVVLSPAYDLLSTALMPIEDKEELALPVNGKKAKLKRIDFEKLAANLGIPTRPMENSFRRIGEAIPKMAEIAKQSFMSKDLKSRYKKLLTDRSKTLGIA
jgi:serine/threonine-protein kinase HipA